ncbi:MAG: hypothetical protein GY737_11705, partial [Desulfobacteraceae bacterium]|nr:hypothetical protein [Desulfobacteraceae bacterium]
MSLGGTRFFSTLDIASAYWQVELAPEDKPKTAFTSFMGLFQYRVMPFGLTNAPATYQRLMENVLSNLIWKKCFVFIDDILVIGHTFDEHLQNLEAVFTRLRQAKLKLKLPKCYFCQPSVPYLGHILSKDGIAADPAKTACIQILQPPTNRKELQHILGVVNYYSKFVPRFSQLASPLYKLLRKGSAWQWTSQCTAAFESIKYALSHSPLLAFPQFQHPFFLQTDASKKAVAGVLGQRVNGQERVIAYFNRTLTSAESNYPALELEALAIYSTMLHFKPYIYGHSVHIETDHSPLKWLFTRKDPPSDRILKWKMKLRQFDYTIDYRPGQTNQPADFLSRPNNDNNNTSSSSSHNFHFLAHSSNQLPSSASPEPSPFLSKCSTELREQQEQDPKLSLLIAYLETGQLPQEDHLARKIAFSSEQFTLLDSILHHLDYTQHKIAQFCIPSTMVPEILQAFHSDKFAGHFAVR